MEFVHPKFIGNPQTDQYYTGQGSGQAHKIDEKSTFIAFTVSIKQQKLVPDHEPYDLVNGILQANKYASVKSRLLKHFSRVVRSLANQFAR
jgi:hypothetical protein